MLDPSTVPDPDGAQRRPLLIFDGDCSFCRRWIARWQRLTGEAVHYQPYQRVAGSFPQIPKTDFGRAVHLVEADGTVTRAAEAVFRSLSLGGRLRGLRWLYEHLPPFRWTAEVLYRLVARNREMLDKIDWTVSRSRK